MIHVKNFAKTDLFRSCQLKINQTWFIHFSYHPFRSRGEHTRNRRSEGTNHEELAVRMDFVFQPLPVPQLLRIASICKYKD